MLLDRAPLVQSTFTLTPQNAPAVAHICHHLDGIPLALELAAARLKLLSVEQIARRLDRRFHLLTGGSRAALPRQQTLRALINWSYDLLSEAERTVLQRRRVPACGRFAGGFTLEAAEAVCTGGDIQPDAVLDLLGQLVEKSLVVTAEQDAELRYQLLEKIRQYGSEKLWEADEGAVARWRYRGWDRRKT
jgi:predicted ATPase